MDLGFRFRSRRCAQPPGRSISTGGSALVGCAEDPFDPPRPSWSSRADGPTCRGDSISSAASSPLPRRLLPCAAASLSSCASPTAAWCATTAAEEARGAPGCCVLESPGRDGLLRRRLPTAPSVQIHRRDGLRGSPSPCPGLHAPPPRRLAAVGGSRRRGGAAPSRYPLLLATGHSRSARAPTLPLTASALLLGPSDLSAGLHPRGRAVPGHGVREGRPLLSPFDFSLCP